MMDDEGRRRLPALVLFLTGASLIPLAFSLVHGPEGFGRIVMYVALGCIGGGIFVGALGIPLAWSKISVWVLVCGLAVLGLYGARFRLMQPTDKDLHEFVRKHPPGKMRPWKLPPDASVGPHQ
jgi:hypothetical protein